MTSINQPGAGQAGGMKRVLVLGLLFIAGAALINSVLIVQRQAALERVSRYNLTWLMSQAAHETLRLQETIDAAALPGSDIDADDVTLRLDVLTNRLALLQKGEAADFVGERPDLKATVAELSTSMATLEILVSGLPDPKVAARMRALRRRSAGRARAQLRCGDLLIDPATHEVLRAGQGVELSAREFAVLMALLEVRPRVLSRQQLEARLYNWDRTVDSNAIEVHVHHLRKKLGWQVIRTLRGVGYFVPEEPAA